MLWSNYCIRGAPGSIRRWQSSGRARTANPWTRAAAPQRRQTAAAARAEMKAHARRAVRDDAAARRKPLAFVGASRVESGARVANGRVLNPQRDPATTPREAEDATREAVEARRTHLEECTTSKRFKEPGQHVLPERHAASSAERPWCGPDAR